MEQIDLGGRVAIVTGGSQGLGKVMAAALAKAGARVAIASPDSGLLERAADEIGRQRALPIVADITIEEDCRRIVAEATRAFSEPDILINNARCVPQQPPREFWKASSAHWKQAALINIFGTFLMSRIAVPGMIARGWGRIINLTTGARGMRQRLNAPYGPTKAAIDSQTLIWAKELEGTGVTVNTLSPGSVVASDVRVQHSKTNKPLADPRVIVPPTLWLASTLSDGHTGEYYAGNRWDARLPAQEAARRALLPSSIRTDEVGEVRA